MRSLVACDDDVSWLAVSIAMFGMLGSCRGSLESTAQLLANHESLYTSNARGDVSQREIMRSFIDIMRVYWDAEGNFEGLS